MSHKQSHVARMELNKKNRLAAGLISERFPHVEGIVLYMTYFQKVSNSVLMVRTVNIFPTDYAYFHMECMIKGCTNGGFNLAPVITDMIKNRKKTAKGSMVCKGKLDVPSSDHASIDYEVSITYKKRSR